MVLKTLVQYKFSRERICIARNVFDIYQHQSLLHVHDKTHCLNEKERLRDRMCDRPNERKNIIVEHIATKYSVTRLMFLMN